MIDTLILDVYGSPTMEEFPQDAEIQNTVLNCFHTVKDHSKIMCSISGGYDSDIMLDMIERCGGHGKTSYVFNNTGLEYEATKRHLEQLKQWYGIEIIETKPQKAIPTCVREYGVPFWSKYVSGMISRLQKHGFQWEDEPFDVLWARYPRCKAALRWWCNDFKSRSGKPSRFNIEYAKGLKEFMLQNPPGFAISPRCCDFVKKAPAHELLKSGGFDLNCTGIRRAEGGARSTAYTSCYDAVFCGADNFRPLFWATDREKDLYRQHFKIRRSDCYELWGMGRTGCAGCPFGKDFEEELRLAEQYEPKMHTAMLAIFGQSYDYTRQYLAFREAM